MKMTWYMVLHDPLCVFVFSQLGNNSFFSQPATRPVAQLQHTLTRIGRCREMDSHLSLAFAMSTHARLGEMSCGLTLPADLVRRICLSARKWIDGPSGTVDGVVRLIGGGLQPLSIF